jgi:DNA mismatch repair ATPase MutS
MTYIQTISTLERFYPQEIIFSSTLENTLLVKKLMGIFRRTSFRAVKRNLFDETKGYYIYALRGNKNEHNPDYKFLSYAALNALILTMENTFEFTLTYSALNIKWHYLEEVLVLDSQTVEDLEIFINK